MRFDWRLENFLWFGQSSLGRWIFSQAPLIMILIIIIIIIISSFGVRLNG
jgi:hypothetical protein